ncbi:MAG: hypothetical protein IKW10_07635 [Oscillospiraceae bacterium]|nr:hypothetical protein [Oscillospiraceae bacterium]
MKKNRLWLIIGIIIFVLGLYQNNIYENESVKVKAVITDIKVEDDTDDASFRYIYYGDYTVNGKTYTHKKLKTEYGSYSTPNRFTGETISLRVYPDHPGRQVSEGGVFGVVGLVLIVWNAVALRKAKKQEKQPET